MKLTSKDLYALGIIDKVIKEPLNGAQEDVDLVANKIKEFILDRLDYYEKLTEAEIVSKRYDKYRKIGKCL